MTTLNGLPVFNMGYDDEFQPSLQLALVDYPSIEVNFLRFKEQKMAFQLAEDRKVVFGPAMIPNFPIFREDADMGQYYIVFNAETIAKVAKGFAVEHKFNLSHNAADEADCTVLESYILNSNEGKVAPAYFGELPDGTWMMKAHIENDALWDDIKAGIYRGFSVESFFNFQQMKKAQKLWRRMLCASVVAKHNDEDIALQYVEDEFAEGIAVYVLDETGALVPAPDGEYTIDGKVYVVADGIIALKPEEVAEPVVEETPAEVVAEPEAMAEDVPEEVAPAPEEVVEPAPDCEARIAALEERIAALEALVATLAGIPDAVEEISEEMKKCKKRNCELDTLIKSLKEVKAAPVEHQSMRTQADANDRLAILFANRK